VAPRRRTHAGLGVGVKARYGRSPLTRSSMHELRTGRRRQVRARARARPALSAAALSVGLRERGGFHSFCCAAGRRAARRCQGRLLSCGLPEGAVRARGRGGWPASSLLLLGWPRCAGNLVGAADPRAGGRNNTQLPQACKHIFPTRAGEWPAHAAAARDSPAAERARRSALSARRPTPSARRPALGPPLASWGLTFNSARPLLFPLQTRAIVLIVHLLAL
jgi:hypothetical protein